MTSLLQVRNVAHRFRGLRVLKGVSFAVEEGFAHRTDRSQRRRKKHAVQHHLRISAAGRRRNRLPRQNRSRGFPSSDRSYAGLIRTFQTPQVFGDLTVRENVIAGCYKQGRSGDR